MFMMPPTRRLVKTAWEWTICCSTHRQQCWTSWRLFDQVLFERPLRREGFIGFWRGNGIRKGGERGEWAEKERESVGLPRKGRLPLLESTSCRSRSAQPIGPLHSKFEQPANQNPPFESYVPRTTWNQEFYVSQYTHNQVSIETYDFRKTAKHPTARDVASQNAITIGVFYIKK